MASNRDFFTGKRRPHSSKKNFIQENIRYLREMKKSKECEPTSRNYNLFPKFQRTFSDVRQLSSLTSNTDVNLRKTESNPFLHQTKMNESLIKDFAALPTGLRHQASQTLEESELDSLYHEGVIRFPSKKNNNDGKGQVKMVREISLQTDKMPSNLSSPTDSRSQSPLLGNPAGDFAKDFVKLNAVVQVQPKKQVTPSPDPIKPPPNYQMGVVPKYLREHKKEQERVQKEKESAEVDPDCPLGHMVLPESERLSQLIQLKQRYAELVNQLNHIPIKSDTLRNRKRKMELEKELDKIDAGIKLFSRDKLYIKISS